VSIAVLAVAATASPLAWGVVLTDASTAALCSQSQVSVSLGATERAPVTHPLKGDLVSLTRLVFTNHGGTCRLPARGPSIRFWWAPPTSGISVPMTTTPVQARDATPGRFPLKSGGSTWLYVYVRGAPSTEEDCHPVTASAIEVSALAGGDGWRTLNRTFPHVCTNKSLASTSYGVAWAQYWAD
jgi:hypothetical protein